MQNRPDINLQPHLSVITRKRPCTSGGVHIRLMFPTRRLSLPLVMVVFSSTALASAYEIDRPDSAVQPSAPYYPLLFSAFISNLAGHLGLGNDRMTLRSLDLVFDLASLESPTGAFQTDTAMRLTGTSCRAPASFNRRSAQENGESVAGTLTIGTPMHGSGYWQSLTTCG